MTRPSPVTRFVVFLFLNAAGWCLASAFPQAAGALAVGPPMGWNSWNKFGCNVSDKLIREMADAMVSSGMKAAGYQYVNIDDCWQVSRDAQGTIVADPERFPSGIKALADYVHSKGLKLGIYTDAGTGTCESMSLIGFGQNGLEKFAGPGHWNDPDMLEIGNGHMNRAEYRTHMALWALLAAPLLAGNDLRDMSAETKELLTSSEVIAVDQDSKGIQGHRCWQEGPLEIWGKPLADGSHAVGLFNRSESTIKMTLDFKTIGAPSSARLRDLLDHKDLGAAQDSYATEVPTHGVVLLKVSK